MIRHPHTREETYHTIHSQVDTLMMIKIKSNIGHALIIMIKI